MQASNLEIARTLLNELKQQSKLIDVLLKHPVKVTLQVAEPYKMITLSSEQDIRELITCLESIAQSRKDDLHELGVRHVEEVLADGQ